MPTQCKIEFNYPKHVTINISTDVDDEGFLSCYIVPIEGNESWFSTVLEAVEWAMNTDKEESCGSEKD